MRIDAYNQISQVYQAGNKTRVNKTGKVNNSDRVEISQFGKDFRRYFQRGRRVQDDLHTGPVRDVNGHVLRVEIDFVLQKQDIRALDQRAAMFDVRRADAAAGTLQ